MGASGVMQRSAIDTSNNVNFGASVFAPAPTGSPGVTGGPARVNNVLKALYDYDPEEEGELQFKSGDEIVVTHRDDSGWWTGTNPAGAIGVFPANYCTDVL